MIAPPELSLIIPMGPLESALPRLIRSGLHLPENWQLIVSQESEQALHPPSDWTVLRGPAGRGRQLNRAAYHASGRWLWFVHADSQPDSEAVESLIGFIRTGPDAAFKPRLAYCALEFDSDGPALTRLNAIGANLRSRFLKLPYGDQGYCLRKQDFDALGGFREDLARGEDLDLVVRAREAGMAIEKIDGTMLTSARRYQSQGWLKTTLAHQAAAYRLVRNAKKKR